MLPGHSVYEESPRDIVTELIIPGANFLRYWALIYSYQLEGERFVEEALTRLKPSGRGIHFFIASKIVM